MTLLGGHKNVVPRRRSIFIFPPKRLNSLPCLLCEHHDACVEELESTAAWSLKNKNTLGSDYQAFEYQTSEYRPN
jgi:hypothetical protein